MGAAQSRRRFAPWLSGSRRRRFGECDRPPCSLARTLCHACSSYEVQDRAPLRRIESDEWPASFLAYLNALECPASIREPLAAAGAAWTEPLLLRAAMWLLGQAISVEYADAANVLNKVPVQALPVASDKAAAAAAGAAGAVASGAAPSSSAQSPQFEAAVRTLAAALRIPIAADAPVDVVLAATRSVVRGHFSAPAAAGGKSAQPAPADVLQLASSELGFSTGDAQLDRAAAALRLLFLADLRDFQTFVNETISLAQASARACRLLLRCRDQSQLGAVAGLYS